MTIFKKATVLRGGHGRSLLCSFWGQGDPVSILRFKCLWAGCQTIGLRRGSVIAISLYHLLLWVAGQTLSSLEHTGLKKSSHPDKGGC